jgi:glycosyltransferase involved in cell wall biosynthesis
MPEVSCIVPVYNVEKYLKRCLDSLLAQTYNDIEIICVDDCSPDSCGEILQEYKQTYPDKIRVLCNKENIGQGRSRAWAIKEAKGEYVMFIDSDDYVSQDYVATYLQEMEKGNFDVVIGGYTKDTDGHFAEHYVTQSDWSILTYTIAWAKMFRKDFLLLHEIDFSDKRQGEDVYFSLCVYYYVKSYKVIPYAGYYYYFNRNSTTGKMNYEIDFEKTVAMMFDTFMGKHDISLISEDKRQKIEYNYMAQMINALITYGHGGGVNRMREKYNYFVSDREKRFPEYRKNPYWNFFRMKGQTMKIRVGVSVVMMLSKLKLERLLFYMTSLI